LNLRGTSWGGAYPAPITGRHWLPALPGIGSRHLHSEKTVAGWASHAMGLNRPQLQIGI
jgi:hypothetical protein